MEIRVDLDDLDGMFLLNLGERFPRLTSNRKVLAIIGADGAVASGRVGTRWVFETAGGARPGNVDGSGGVC